MKWLLAFTLWVDGFASTPRQVYVIHKTMHFVGGLAIYYAFDLAGYPKTGLSLVWATGIGKEILDRHMGGSFRCGDVAWTVVAPTICFVVRW